MRVLNPLLSRPESLQGGRSQAAALHWWCSSFSLACDCAIAVATAMAVVQSATHRLDMQRVRLRSSPLHHSRGSWREDSHVAVGAAGVAGEATGGALGRRRVRLFYFMVPGRNLACVRSLPRWGALTPRPAPAQRAQQSSQTHHGPGLEVGRGLSR